MLIYHKEDHIKTVFGIDYNICGNFPTYHGHDYWEFIYLFSPATQLLNGIKYQMVSNTITIIKPGDCHSFTNCNDHVGQVNFKITDAKLQELCNAFGDDVYNFFKTTNAEQLILHTNNNFASNIASVCNTLLSVPNHPTKNPIMYKLAISTIIEYIYRHLSYLSDSVDLPNTVKGIIKELSTPANFSMPLSDILKVSNYSYSQATRLLKKYTGKKPNEIFFNAKMQYACNQLILNNCKIIEIASMIGYSSQAHFDTAFKSVYGISPQDFRKLNGSTTH